MILNSSIRLFIVSSTNHSRQEDITAIHGVFLDVLGMGVLLTGVSGVGKSEIALALINRGHKLVADDSVQFKVNSSNKIIGRCPPVLQDFLEVRGLGILNVRAMFGDTAIKKSKPLQLVVNVINIDSHEMHNIDRLNGMHRVYRIFDIEVPEVSIPVAPGRNLSILVEAAVRNQLLKLTGYNASKEFISNQQQFITREDS